MPMIRIFLCALIMTTFSVGHGLAQKGRPIDREATAETKALFKSLRKLSKKHTLFGHQHATEYGRGWSNEPGAFGCSIGYWFPSRCHRCRPQWIFRAPTGSD